jgi:hypothetical protein
MEARAIDSIVRLAATIASTAVPLNGMAAMRCSASDASACDETQFGVRLQGARRPSRTPRLPGRFPESIGEDATIAALIRSRARGNPMLQISALQLAELLTGIGRAQAAVVQGLENELAGVRSGRIVPAVQNVSHSRDHPEPTLVDLPVRILLASMGRAGGADTAAIAKDLERLFSQKDSLAKAPAENLDFSKPG